MTTCSQLLGQASQLANGYPLLVSPLNTPKWLVRYISGRFHLLRATKKGMFLPRCCGHWRLENLKACQLPTSIPHGDPHLAASQAGSGWWPWPVPRRSPRPRGSCRGGTPRREGRTAGRWSRSKAWCTSRCQQGDPSRPQLAWFLPWKPVHPAQQGQPLPSRGSAWAEWRQATPSASTAPTPRHPGTSSRLRFVLQVWVCIPKMTTGLIFVGASYQFGSRRKNN